MSFTISSSESRIVSFEKILCIMIKKNTCIFIRFKSFKQLLKPISLFPEGEQNTQKVQYILFNLQEARTTKGSLIHIIIVHIIR